MSGDRRLLVVFDAEPPARALRRAARRANADVIELHPLTSSWNAIAAVERAARAAARHVEVADTALALNEEAARMRERLPAAIAALGTTPLDGVPLRERLLDRTGASSWWSTPIAERNPLVSPFVTRLAQCATVERRLAAAPPDAMAVCIGPADLRAAVVEAGRQLEPEVLRPAHGAARRARTWLWSSVQTLKPAAEAVRMGVRALQARTTLGRPARFARDQTVFVTYFPALAPGAAEGEFRDRYFAPVRDLIVASGRRVGWLLLPLPIDGRPFGAAMSMAAGFQRAGEHLSTWEQWLTPSGVARAFRRRRAMMRVYRKWRRDLEGAAVEACGVRAARPILARALRRSFIGVRTFQALLMREAFERVLDAGRPERLVYCAEFQPWEAALCGAAAAHRVCAIGFQHTTIPANLYNYRRTTLETETAPERGGMPLPDVVAASGSRSAALLRAGGVRGVHVVEAIRHGHVQALLAAAHARRSRLAAVIGSIDRRETIAMLELIDAARGLMPDLEFVLRAHPIAPVDGDGDGSWTWKRTTEPTSQLLMRAAVAIVASSSVAVDALAAGCRVVQPLFGGTLPTGSLEAAEGWHVAVSRPEELATAVRAAMAEAAPDASALVRDMWLLDDGTLGAWTGVLGLTANAATAPRIEPARASGAASKEAR